MKSKLSGCFKLTVIFFIFLLPEIGFAELQTGPLGVVNQFPPHMMFLTPMPRSPQTPQQGSLHGALALDYFSVYSNAASDDYRVLMDMEAAVLDLRLRYGLTDRLSVGLRVPMVSMQDGVLDGPLEGFHRAFGLPNYGKEKSPDNQFAYNIRQEGEPIFIGQEGGLHLTDPTLAVQMQLGDYGRSIPTKIGVTYEIKLPMGDESRGFGSGAVDHGFFLPVRFKFSDLNLYLMPGYILVGTPHLKNVQLAARDIQSLFVGAEYRFSPVIALLTQVNTYTSPFENTGIVKLDWPSVELAFGLRWAYASKASVEFSFSEDLTRAAPDFNLHVLFGVTLF